MNDKDARAFAIAFAKLLATFPPLYRLTADELALKLAVYFDALTDFDISDVTAAMLELQRHRRERWTPTPGEIRAAVEARKKAPA